MKTKVKNLLILTVLLFAGVLAETATAETESFVAVVQGGSIGEFVAGPHSLTTSGFSKFAVDLRLRSDGSAFGEFVCSVRGVVVLAGQAVSGFVNSNGTVTFVGREYGYDVINHTGYTDCPFVVTLHAGGPNVGWFKFRDCAFPAGEYDGEVVRVGTIYITQ